MLKITNVISDYNAKTNLVTVTLRIARENAYGAFVYCGIVTGRAEWDIESDPHGFEKCFKIAYERAFAKIPPDENIIEKCGGLRNGDWVRLQDKRNNDIVWGIVFNGNILYMMGSDNYDRVSTFSNGESDYDRITTIVRPTNPSCPITYEIIHEGLYLKASYIGNCEVYTAD